MVESEKLIVDDNFTNMCGDLDMTRCQLNLLTSMINDRLEREIVYETELYNMLGMNGCGSDNKGIIASDISIDTRVDINKQNNKPTIVFVLEYEREV